MAKDFSAHSLWDRKNRTLFHLLAVAMAEVQKYWGWHLSKNRSSSEEPALQTAWKMCFAKIIHDQTLNSLNWMKSLTMSLGNPESVCVSLSNYRPWLCLLYFRRQQFLVIDFFSLGAFWFRIHSAWILAQSTSRQPKPEFRLNYFCPTLPLVCKSTTSISYTHSTTWQQELLCWEFWALFLWLLLLLAISECSSWLF